MTIPTLTRREILMAAGAAAVAGLTLQGRDSFVAQPVLALLDGALSEPELARARSVVSPLQYRVLSHDLVWQWRRELRQKLVPGMRIVAITRWDKALVLSGLGREAGLRARQTRLAPSLFRTDLG